MKKKNNWIPLVLFVVIGFTLSVIITMVKSPIWIPIAAGASFAALIGLVFYYENQIPKAEWSQEALYRILKSLDSVLDNEMNTNNTIQTLIEHFIKKE